MNQQQGNSFAQQVQQGQFPHLNEVRMIGQLWPTKYMQHGAEWKEGQQGRDGQLIVNVKVRKEWGGNNPGVSQKTYKLKAYGNVGQQISQQLQQALQQCPQGCQPVFEFQGEMVVKRFQSGPNSKNPGQWNTDVHVLVKQVGGRNGYVPFQVIGALPAVDEGNQGNNGGFGGNNGGGGFQQQPQAPGGGFQQPQQGQPQPQAGGFGPPAGGQQPGGFGGAPQGQPAPQQGGGFQQPQQPQQGQPQGGQPYSSQPQGQPAGGFGPGSTPAAGNPQPQQGAQPAGNFAPPAGGAPQGQPQGGGQAPPPNNPF